MGSKKRFFGCIKRRKKWADEGIGPYKAQCKPKVQIWKKTRRGANAPRPVFLRSLLVFVALAVHGAVRAVRAAGGLSGLLLSQQIHDNEGHNDS